MADEAKKDVPVPAPTETVAQTSAQPPAPAQPEQPASASAQPTQPAAPRSIREAIQMALNGGFVLGFEVNPTTSEKNLITVLPRDLPGKLALNPKLVYVDQALMFGERDSLKQLLSTS